MLVGGGCRGGKEPQRSKRPLFRFECVGELALRDGLSETLFEFAFRVRLPRRARRETASAVTPRRARVGRRASARRPSTETGLSTRALGFAPSGAGAGARGGRTDGASDPSSGSREEPPSGDASRGHEGASRGHGTRPAAAREGRARRHEARSFLRPSTLRGPPSRLAEASRRPPSGSPSGESRPRARGTPAASLGKRASPAGGARPRREAETPSAAAGRPPSGEGSYPVGIVPCWDRSLVGWGGTARPRSSFPGGRRRRGRRQRSWKSGGRREAAQLAQGDLRVAVLRGHLRLGGPFGVLRGGGRRERLAAR